MRHCFRMKKLATPPASATNHRFHSYGWSRALNYVAKAYMVGDQIDSSDSGVEAVLSDVLLQYEAMKWAEEFNKLDPPKVITIENAIALITVHCISMRYILTSLNPCSPKENRFPSGLRPAVCGQGRPANVCRRKIHRWQR